MLYKIRIILTICRDFTIAPNGKMVSTHTNNTILQRELLKVLRFSLIIEIISRQNVKFFQYSKLKQKSK